MTDSPEAKLVTPAFILSVTSVLITGIVSGVTIYTTSEQKQREIEIQELKNEADRKTSRGELVFKNIGLLNSKDSNEQKLAVAALVYTLGQVEAQKLLTTVQTVGPDAVRNVVKNARSEISNEHGAAQTSTSGRGIGAIALAGASSPQTGSLHFAFDRRRHCTRRISRRPPFVASGENNDRGAL